MSELLRIIVAPTTIESSQRKINCPVCDEGYSIISRYEVFEVKEYDDGIKATMHITSGMSPEGCYCYREKEHWDEDYTEEYLKDPQQLIERLGIPEHKY